MNNLIIQTNETIQNVAPVPASHWYAKLALRFVHTKRGVVLRESKHQGPLYVQKPFYPEGRDVAHAYILHPPGGIVSGDRLEINVTAGEGAHVLITTPGAGRVYRARADKTTQHQHITLNAQQGACIEWLPLETIIFNGAHTQLKTTVSLAKGATFIGWDVTCLGLQASQSYFTQGEIQQTFQITVEGRISLRERLAIDADNSKKSPVMQAKSGLQHQCVNGFMVAGPFDEGFSVSHDCEILLAALRDVLSDDATALLGVTLVNKFIVIRYLGACSEQARRLFSDCWASIRPVLLGKEMCRPRIWAT